MPSISIIKKIAAGTASFIAVFVIGLFYGNDIIIHFENDDLSVSTGTTANGKLVNGKRLPTKGNNFIAYSYLGTLLGRNTVNNRVRDTIVDTYEHIYSKYPELMYVYGETGQPGGGSFKPHKSHQNGMSVDFMVPIVDKNGQPFPLPTSVLNKFGYSIEFDSAGRTNNYQIDFDSMSIHLYELNSVARSHGIIIDRVIFAPELQPHLFNTKHGRIIKNIIKFSTKPSWVRHDEHYHVDFKSAS